MLRFKDNKGLWYELDPDTPGMARIRMRELTLDEIDEIDKSTITDDDIVLQGVPFTKKKVNHKAARRKQMQKAIVDWEGIYIGDDVELAECNDVNKVRIMKQTDFVKLLIPVYAKINKSNASVEAARVKNSEDSSSGNAD